MLKVLFREEKGVNLKFKRDLYLVRQVKPIKEIIKGWYNKVGMKFLASRNLQDLEEDFLEEVSDFFLSDLESIDKQEKEILEKLNDEDYNTLKHLPTNIPDSVWDN